MNILKKFEQISSSLCQYEQIHNKKMAVIYAFSSQIFFISMFTCVGLLRQGYSTQQIVQGRMCIGFVLNYLFCHLQKISIYPKNKLELKLLVFRGIFGGITMLLVFETFKYLNMSDAIIITNTNPIWTNFLAAAFLGEKLTKKSVIFCFVSFAGIILIVKPSFIFGDTQNSQQIEGRDQFYGCILGLISAVFISILSIIVSKMQRQMKCNNAQLLMFSYLFTCIISGIVQVDKPNDEFKATPRYLQIITIIGIVGFVAQLVYSRSFTLEKASVISPLQYTEVIMSFGIDILLFNEQIYFTSIIGAILVVIGSIAIII